MVRRCTSVTAWLAASALIVSGSGCAQLAAAIVIGAQSGGGGDGGGSGGGPSSVAPSSAIPFDVELSVREGSTTGGAAVTAEIVTAGVAMDGSLPITVLVDGVPALDVRLISPELISFLVPPSGQGNRTRSVVIELRQGGFASRNATFTYRAFAPQVFQLQPGNGPQAGGTLLTLTGSGFVTGCTVLVGGSLAQQAVAISEGQLACLTPPGSGIQPVRVLHPEGFGADSPQGFSYDAAFVPPPPPPPPPGPVTSFLFFGQTLPSPSQQAVFVLDHSASASLQVAAWVDENGASRTGSILDRLRSEVIKTLRALPDGFEVNLAAYDECVTYLWTMRRPLTAARRLECEAFLAGLAPSGFTATGPAVAWALGDPTNDTVVVASDGAPNIMDCAVTVVGTTADHLAAARTANLQGAAVHALAMAVGTPNSDQRAALMGLANQAGGIYWEVDLSAAAPLPVGTLDPPDALQAVAVSPTRVDLTWRDRASGETSYQVLRSPAGAGTFIQLSGSLPPDSTAYSDTTVQPATSYDYRVAARDATSVSSYATVSVTTPPAGPPPLSVTALTPCASTLAGGAILELRGSGFNGGVTAVSVGGVAATSLQVLSDDRLTCVAPAHAAGLVDLVVTGPGGTVTLSQAFAYGTSVLSEDFTGALLPVWLEDPDSGFASGGGVIRRSNATALFERAYLRTRDADWITRDFVYELTFANSASNIEIQFLGIGSGLPDPSNTNEPLDGVFFRVHESGFESGRVDWHVSGAGGVYGQTLGATNGGGPHRFRMVKRGMRLTLSLDVNWTGVFVPDMSTTFDALGTGAPFLDTTDSHLFFGAERNGVWFDDACLVELEAPPLQVVRATPPAGPPAGGTSVTLTGSGFLAGGIPQVTFGGVPASAPIVIDDHTLTCVSPPGVESTQVDVQVTNAAGSATAPDAWSYTGHAFVFEPLGTVLLDPNLEDPDDAFDQASFVFRSGLGNSRHYLRTRLSDYGARDFVYEQAFTLGSDGSVNVAFIGVSSTVNDGSGEPGNSIHFRLHPANVVGGRVDVAVAGGTGGLGGVGHLTSEGPHRARISKLGDTLTLEIDADSQPGSPFVADISHTIPSLTAAAPFLSTGPSHLFYGATFPPVRFGRTEVR